VSDVENMRRVLSQLPPPPWRSIIEKEIQSGLEAVTMSLFHNKATYRILKKVGAMTCCVAVSVAHEHISDSVFASPHFV